MSSSSACSKLLPDEEPGAISLKKDDLFCQLYRERVAAEGPPMLDGLSDALALVKDLGIRCVAVTNAPRGAAEACIEYCESEGEVRRGAGR